MSKVRDPYGALADPTRRTILEVLRDRPEMTAGQIADRFPRVTRASVSKHLRVLRESLLVSARELGREWHHRLQPSRLAEVESWLSSFAPLWEQSLQNLKERSEEPR